MAGFLPFTCPSRELKLEEVGPRIPLSTSSTAIPSRPDAIYTLIDGVGAMPRSIEALKLILSHSRAELTELSRHFHRTFAIQLHDLFQEPFQNILCFGGLDSS